MSNDDCIKLATDAGWKPIKGVILDGIPAFQKDGRYLWRHPTGVTVAELTGDGSSVAVKYRNHRYYQDVAEAVTMEAL